MNKGIYKENAPKGVYILTESNSLVLSKFWGLYEDSEKPVCVAIIGDRNLIVGLKGSDGSVELLDWEKDLPSEKLESADDALKHDKGQDITVELAKLGSNAAMFCEEYHSGQITKGNWYLPTLADFQLMYDNKKELDIALSICGGDAIETDDWHWTSTRRYDKSYWVFSWSYGGRSNKYQDFSGKVRPVSAFQLFNL